MQQPQGFNATSPNALGMAFAVQIFSKTCRRVVFYTRLERGLFIFRLPSADLPLDVCRHGAGEVVDAFPIGFLAAPPNHHSSQEGCGSRALLQCQPAKSPPSTPCEKSSALTSSFPGGVSTAGRSQPALTTIAVVNTASAGGENPK